MAALHIKIKVVVKYQIMLVCRTVSALNPENLSRKSSFFDHEGHTMKNTVACKIALIALLWRSCSN